MVTATFTGWLYAGNGIVISRVTAYEFRRGVYAGSVKPVEAHAGELFLVNFAVIEVDEDTWDLAAEIWGRACAYREDAAHGCGQPDCGDRAARRIRGRNAE